MARFTDQTHGILWMMVTGFLNICIFAVMRYLSEKFGYQPFQLMFFYCVFGLACYLPMTVRKLGSLKTRSLPMFALRSVLEFASFSMSVSALTRLPVETRLPLPMHTALGFTSPIFGSIVAVLLLKEKNTIHRWISLLIGFVGILIVQRPGVNDFNISALYVIGAAIGFSFTGVCIKILTRNETPQQIAFYMLALTGVVALPFAISVWTPFAMASLPLLVLLGLLVAIVQFTVGLAYAKANMTVILPFNFLNLVWSTLISLAVFGQGIDLWTVVGGAVIMAGAFYGIHHQSRANMRATIRAAAGGS